MRKVIKGINYTKVITSRKNSSWESVQHWVLPKKSWRKSEDCGVWIDGKKIRDYSTMKKVKP